MTQNTRRSILRWIHIILSIPICGYIYSPNENLPQYSGPTRFVFFPLIVLTGLWMWKGHVVRRLISKKSANKTTGMKTGQEFEAQRSNESIGAY